MMDENDKRHAAGEPSPERKNRIRSYVSFPMVDVVTTSGVLNTFARWELLLCLSRHMQEVWGDACAEDCQNNDESLNEKESDRLLSCHEFDDGRRLWINTEQDRSVTILLLPEEY